MPLWAQWVSVLVGVATLVVLIFRTGRASGAYLTRAEHERICEKRNVNLNTTLHEMRMEMKEDRQAATEFRNALADKLTCMEVRLATAIPAPKRRRR